MREGRLEGVVGKSGTEEGTEKGRQRATEKSLRKWREKKDDIYIG